MRRARVAVRDVEVVDVVTDLPLVGPGDAHGTPGTDDAAETARAARRRRTAARLARRWWPVPVLAVAALVAAQLVVDARERDRVAARQEVPGVLRSVEPALAPTRTLRDDRFDLSLTGITVAGDLRIALATGSWGDARALVALGPDGEPAWRASLDPPTGGTTPPASLQFPACAAGPGEAAPELRCLVVDRDSSDALEDASGWPVDTPVGARLLTLDAATGATTASRAVPPLSGWGGAGDLQVLASVVDGGLRVSAWDVGTPGPGDPVDADPVWRTDVDLGDDARRLVYAPDLAVARGRVVVHTDTGSVALDAADGTVRARDAEYLGISRTGYLTTGTATLLDDDGDPLATLPGQPVHLLVDDGGLPSTEVVVRLGGREQRRLTAVDLPGGTERWSVPADGWTDGALVLLEGVLYGTDPEGAWARDAGTGDLLWRTDVPLAAELGATALTDGRYLLGVGRPDQLARAGITVAPAAGARSDAGPGTPSGTAAPGAERAVVAFDLGTGRPAWATRLPDGVRAVWPDGDDLVGWGDDAAVLLN